MAVTAAAQLLEQWAPIDQNTGETAARVALILDKAPPPQERTWTSAPTAVEVAEYGAYPETFAEAGPLGRRHPVAVETLNAQVQAGPGMPWLGVRAAPDVAGQVAQLLSATFSAGNQVLDRRAQLLIDYVADELTRRCDDLLLISVAAEPGGSPIGDELHLLRRDIRGGTLRLAVAPAASVPRLAGPRPGTAGSPAEDDHLQAVFRARAASAIEVLSDFLWLTNNDRASVEVRVEPHGLNLDPADPDAGDLEVRAWWPETDFWGEIEEQCEDFDPEPTRLDADAFANVRASLEEQFLTMARARDWALGADEEEVPGDHLVTWLGQDLFDTVTARVTGGPDIPPLLAYAIGLPVQMSDEDYGFYGCLLLFGPERVGIVTIDANF